MGDRSQRLHNTLLLGQQRWDGYQVGPGSPGPPKPKQQEWEGRKTFSKCPGLLPAARALAPAETFPHSVRSSLAYQKPQAGTQPPSKTTLEAKGWEYGVLRTRRFPRACFSWEKQAGVGKSGEQKDKGEVTRQPQVSS